MSTLPGSELLTGGGVCMCESERETNGGREGSEHHRGHALEPWTLPHEPDSVRTANIPEIEIV